LQNIVGQASSRASSLSGLFQQPVRMPPYRGPLGLAVGGSLRRRLGIGCRFQKALEFRQDQQVFGATGCAFGPNQARQIQRPHLTAEGRQPHTAFANLIPAPESRNFRQKVDSTEIRVQGKNAPSALT
jgi:hypothetical protein